MTRPSAGATIVSIGYEQRSIEQVVDLLKQNRVEVVVDVRLNPISRKRGFSKSSLQLALDAADIKYRHERHLGNPKSNRDPFRRGLETARTRYALHLNNGAYSSYRDVMALAQSARIALLCFEREHDNCHRSSILDAARADVPALQVLKL